jgi:hypothetical protein
MLMHVHPYPKEFHFVGSSSANMINSFRYPSLILCMQFHPIFFFLVSFGLVAVIESMTCCLEKLFLQEFGKVVYEMRMNLATFIKSP